MAKTRTSPKAIVYQELLTKAVSLRMHKVAYSEIIEKLGHWKSVSACQKAVVTFLKNNQLTEIEDSRAEAIAFLEEIIFELKDKFKKSKSVLIAREMRNYQHQLNQLQGNYAPTKLAHEGKDGEAEIQTGIRVILPTLPEPDPSSAE